MASCLQMFLLCYVLKVFSINLRYVFRVEPLSGNDAEVRIKQKSWTRALEYEPLLLHLPAVRPWANDLTSLYLRDNNDTYSVGCCKDQMQKIHVNHMEKHLSYTSHIVSAQSTSYNARRMLINCAISHF